MGALTRGDKIERQLQKRILTAYTEALKTSVEGIKDFLREIQRVEDGVKKPPAFYDTPEKIERWKAGFYRELVRRYRVQEIIMEEINRAGALAAGEIREAMADVYMDNLGEVQQLISAGATRAGVNVSFAAPTRRQVAAGRSPSWPTNGWDKTSMFASGFKASWRRRAFWARARQRLFSGFAP